MHIHSNQCFGFHYNFCGILSVSKVRPIPAGASELRRTWCVVVKHCRRNEASRRFVRIAARWEGATGEVGLVPERSGRSRRLERSARSWRGRRDLGEVGIFLCWKVCERCVGFLLFFKQAYRNWNFSRRRAHMLAFILSIASLTQGEGRTRTGRQDTRKSRRGSGRPARSRSGRGDPGKVGEAPEKSVRSRGSRGGPCDDPKYVSSSRRGVCS